MHQNIASVLAKRHNLEFAIDELSKENREPDIICISETFIKKGSEANIKVHNYKLATSFSRGKSRGGVCILAKLGITYKEIETLKRSAIVNTFECCGIEVPKYNAAIICIYRTPNSMASVFLDKLDIMLHELCNKYKKIIVCGDFNINVLTDSKNSNRLVDLTNNYNLTIHILKPTRGKTCIDNIISNVRNASATVGIAARPLRS